MSFVTCHSSIEVGRPEQAWCSSGVDVNSVPELRKLVPAYSLVSVCVRVAVVVFLVEMNMKVRAGVEQPDDGLVRY